MVRLSTATAVSLLLSCHVVVASQILKTSGFSECLTGSVIKVNNVDIQYNNDAKTVTFNVGGTSTKSINVTAQLNVTAYGTEVYQRSFNPCDADTFVEQLCPVPVGNFAASGTQEIPASYASLIPSIAFSVPDIAAQATLELKELDTGKNVACITSAVENGKTVNIPAVSYVAAGIAGAALVITGVSAIGAAGAGGGSTGGSGTISPSFTDVITTMQGFAINGMSSAQLPIIYRNFAKNFAFSTGLVPWEGLQTAIDSFRGSTGGNLTADSVKALKNTTLVYQDGKATVARRSLGLVLRDTINTSINSTSDLTDSSSNSTIQKTVSGIQAYAEQLTVPQSNTFMTVLLIVAIVIATIVVGILLFKVILEVWSLFGSFPQSLIGFRKHYWGTMARAIVQLILVLYGVVVLYCIFQFTHGDSWAAQTLAGVTLALFTAILAFFAFKIWKTAHKLKEIEGNTSGLYDNKEHWLKYSLFYDAYKKDFWWLFIPVIVYMFAKGCVLAAADGHGLSQTIGQLVIECVMLGLLIWNRPFERRSGNVIGIFIQIVRALSVVCILVFVEELGIAQTTQTITGVVLVVVQSLLTGVLAILIAANAIIMCCKENPHRKRRKEAEKMNRDFDNLTPLDARNSLLMDPARVPLTPMAFENNPKSSSDSYMREPTNPYAGATPLRSYRNMGPLESTENLVQGAAPLGGDAASPPRAPSVPRQPTVPNMGVYRGY